MLCGSGEKMHKGHAQKEWMSEFRDASKRNHYPRCRSHIFFKKEKTREGERRETEREDISDSREH